MLVVKKIKNLIRWRKQNPKVKKLGFVPTMGDLHEGHLSLIRRSQKENDLTALSIFVNPIQFNDLKDFKRYKINLSRDLEVARSQGVDIVFAPKVGEIYPPNFQTYVQVEKLSGQLCGPFRPGHFQGVATIVLKLFHLLQPDKAYFGMKDYQQYRLIEQMVRDLNLAVKIVPCPTIRDANGLAYSSRNQRLSSQERERANRIYPALQSVANLLRYKKTVNTRKVHACFRKNLKLSKSDRVDYIEVVEPRNLMRLKKVEFPLLVACAVWIGKTRLIDNILLEKAGGGG